MSGVIPSDNKHAISSRKVLDHLKSLGASLNGWELASEQDGVKIYTHNVEGGLPMTRGDIIYEGDLNLEQLGAIALSPGSRKIWDERFEDAEVKERYTRRETLFHSKSKGTWPVSGRDFVGTTLSEYIEGKEFYVSMHSVEEPSLPAISGYVRADLHLSGWIFKQLDDKKVSVTYIVHIDLNGSIPSAFVKKVQLQTPLCAGKVIEYGNQHGFPPLVKDILGRIRNEEFDHNKKQYTLEVDALEEHIFLGLGEKTGNVTVEVSKKMFPNGFTVTTSLKENVHEKQEVGGNTLVVIKHIKDPVVITITHS